MASAKQVAQSAHRKDVLNRWLLSTPALLIILFAAVGPLFIVLLYSFMVKGDYGDVKFWQFSLDGWFNVFLAARHLRRHADDRRCPPGDLLALGEALPDDHHR